MTTFRGRFARLAIEIDIKEPLTVSFSIDGEEQRVEYESLPSVCFNCSRVGHGARTCAEKAKHTGGQPMEGATTRETEGVNEVNMEGVSEKGSKFGPWIHVQYRNRRNNSYRREGKEVKGEGKLGAQQEDLRFRALKDMAEEVDTEQEVGDRRGKKIIEASVGREVQDKEYFNWENQIIYNKEGVGKANNGGNVVGVRAKSVGKKSGVQSKNIELGSKLGRGEWRITEGTGTNQILGSLPLLQGVEAGGRIENGHRSKQAEGTAPELHFDWG